MKLNDNFGSEFIAIKTLGDALPAGVSAALGVSSVVDAMNAGKVTTEAVGGCGKGFLMGAAWALSQLVQVELDSPGRSAGTAFSRRLTELQAECNDVSGFVMQGPQH